jgi:hypothetical protein
MAKLSKTAYAAAYKALTVYVMRADDNWLFEDMLLSIYPHIGLESISMTSHARVARFVRCAYAKGSCPHVTRSMDRPTKHVTWQTWVIDSMPELLALITWASSYNVASVVDPADHAACIASK